MPADVSQACGHEQNLTGFACCVTICQHPTCDVLLLLQLVLQEVAWDEASRERKRAERAAIVAQYQDIGDLQHKPLFCAETALKVVHARVCGRLAAQPACAHR